MDYFWSFELNGEKFFAHTEDRPEGHARPSSQQVIRKALLRAHPGVERLYFLGAAHPDDAPALHDAAQAGLITGEATFKLQRDRIATARMAAC